MKYEHVEQQFAKVANPLIISPINDLQQIHRIRNHMQQQRYIRQQKVLQKKKMFGFCKLHLYQRPILLPFLPLFAISWRRVTESLLEVIQLMKLQHTHNIQIPSNEFLGSKELCILETSFQGSPPWIFFMKAETPTHRQYHQYVSFHI